jgi:CRISPR-associated endonuclease Csn1
VSSPSTVWAFDLGKASIGEAVRCLSDNSFPHVQSLLLPEDFARRGPATVSGSPANRYRALKTREAHHAREEWLRSVWQAAGLTPLLGRRVACQNGRWQQVAKADYRLEREFAPKIGQKTRDRAPSDESGSKVYYTSCLLRILLLQGRETLEEWQIFKALHSALQSRGYGRVPWATKEARRLGKSAAELEEEDEKALQNKDPLYRDAVGQWPRFKREVAPSEEFQYPCYYDAWRMGLWDPSQTAILNTKSTHLAQSTRNVRFDRDDVRKEITALGNRAIQLIPKLSDAFDRWKTEGWSCRHPYKKDSILTYSVRAESFGEFLCDGPAGHPVESSYESFLSQRRSAKIRVGTFEEWMGALGQKTPRFDNRILNSCVLIPRFHVCKVDVKVKPETGQVVPDSLLANEVTFLLKLKNLLVADPSAGQRKLTPCEIREVFEYAHRKLQALQDINPEKGGPNQIAKCFSLSKTEWAHRKKLNKPDLRPLPNHEEVASPRTTGRSAYSRVALRILKELILSGETPSGFHARLIRGEPELLSKLGPEPSRPLALFEDSDDNKTNEESRRKGMLISELRFLLEMRRENDRADSWENLFVPSQTVEALKARHSEDGVLDSETAIQDLLGTIKDPIVRHRLEVFSNRLRLLQAGDKTLGISGFGIPDSIVIEFIREDFMGEKARREYQKFINDREKGRKAFRAQANELQLTSRSAALRVELAEQQGWQCLYTGQTLSQTQLDEYEIDHIVPRALGGPDAVVNYVLTTREFNQAKAQGNSTPYAILKGSSGWDAYVSRVTARASNLRNKKVQLLTREDAPELVQRYTALAETAWIAKLAQTVVNLRFGWNNGIDSKGQRRVTVISGGLTSRVRRKYGLDPLLYTEATDAETLEKQVKNRADDRHHALDAMVLTFIPQWARDPQKAGFFRFPEGFRDPSGRENHKMIRDHFGKSLRSVIPRHLATEKAQLADTVYGVRGVNDQRCMVQRVRLSSLAQKPAGPQKTVFDREYARGQIASILDEATKRRILDFLGQSPNEAQWNAFCDSLRQQGSGGRLGAHIRLVRVKADKTPTEFKDLSKDETGAYRRSLKNHRGQFVYLDSRDRPVVVAVRVFESVASVRKELMSRREFKELIGFFETACLVALTRPLVTKAVSLPAGIYKLNTIRQDAVAQVSDASGHKHPPVSLSKFLQAGFRRAD